MYQAMVREGIASGELIDVDWLQIHLAALGANVFYFLSAPMWRMLLPFEPFAPEALERGARRLVEFLGQAIFHRSAAWRRAGRARACRYADARSELPIRCMFGRKDERTK